jgi:hypothetical protein
MATGIMAGAGERSQPRRQQLRTSPAGAHRAPDVHQSLRLGRSFDQAGFCPIIHRLPRISWSTWICGE